MRDYTFANMALALSSPILTNRKWVFVSSLINTNKGRQMKIFDLSKTIDGTIDMIRDGISGGHAEQKIMIKTIRVIIRS